MRRILIYLVALACVCPASIAIEERSAEELMQACETEDAYCAGFIAGTLSTHRVRDSYSLVVSGQQLLCIPDDITVEQFRKDFMAYVKPRRKEWKWDASALALAALEHYYACIQ
ncbi:MAG: Rap1a/Tai family immunity protein [Pseudomonadota bacterium]